MPKTLMQRLIYRVTIIDCNLFSPPYITDTKIVIGKMVSFFNFFFVCVYVCI